MNLKINKNIKEIISNTESQYVQMFFEKHPADEMRRKFLELMVYESISLDGPDAIEVSYTENDSRAFTLANISQKYRYISDIEGIDDMDKLSAEYRRFIKDRKDYFIDLLEKVKIEPKQEDTLISKINCKISYSEAYNN